VADLKEHPSLSRRELPAFGEHRRDCSLRHGACSSSSPSSHSLPNTSARTLMSSLSTSCTTCGPSSVVVRAAFIQLCVWRELLFELMRHLKRRYVYMNWMSYIWNTRRGLLYQLKIPP
jgi:hypothetical protein